MSVISRTQEEILEEMKKLIAQKNEFIETLHILAKNVSKKLLEGDQDEIPDWEESELEIIRYIETREPFLEKINEIDAKVRELVITGNNEVKQLQENFPEKWSELLGLEHYCRDTTDKILKIDGNLMPLIEMAFAETKEELKKTTKSKKAFNAYGKNAGKI